MRENLRERWDMGWITEKTLRGWVSLHRLDPDLGLTEDDFEEITGRPFHREEEVQ